jgi:hypothetical protein
LITLVVLVCSPLRVATAKGSGNPIEYYQHLRSIDDEGLPTEDIALVESISSNDYDKLAFDAR